MTRNVCLGALVTLIGDAALPEEERLTKTNIRVITNGPGKWPLEASGLLGPVTLVSPKP